MAHPSLKVDWPQDDSVEWLTPTDFLVSLMVVRSVKSEPPRVLEVGVWKGGWSLTLARNSGAEIVGIDPYPGIVAIRDRVLDSVTSLALGDRFSLHRSWAEMRAIDGGVFNLIHLDGEHSEQALAEDLREADRALAEGGVLIIDDIIHPYFPGVAAAAYRFFLQSGYRPFLYTLHKVFCCREHDHGYWYGEMQARLAKSPLIIERYYGEHSGEMPYVQMPDVYGAKVLLCVAPENSDRVRELFESARPEATPAVKSPLVARRRRAMRLRAFARRWLPRTVHRRIARMVNRFSRRR